MLKSSLKPPLSSVPAITVYAGMVGFFLGCVLLWGTKISSPLRELILLVATALPMWWREWRCHQIVSEKIESKEETKISPRSVRTNKLIGLFFVLLTWLSTFALFSIAAPDGISGFLDLLFFIGPALLVLLLAFVWVDGYAGDLADLGWSVVEAIRDKQCNKINWDILRSHLVKAFFLPFMLGALSDLSHQFFIEVPSTQNSLVWFKLPMAGLYLMDVSFGAVGYLSGFKKVGAHVRSSNPYWGAWFAALACYPPFFTWLGLLGLTYYREGPSWHEWLSAYHPIIVYSWGGVILLLTGVYVWATVSFGIRFSNLTNRGIITSGPYRWTKHPAYIAKNLSWWLMFVPFFTYKGIAFSLLGCVCLSVMNVVYWIRAKTEEKHLYQDGDYVVYAKWINEFGLFAKLIKHFKRQDVARQSND